MQLKFRGGDHSAVVFEAFRSSGDRWTLRYRHPLSAFQAFNLAIAILHNQTTAMLDMLPPLPRLLLPSRRLPRGLLAPLVELLTPLLPMPLLLTALLLTSSPSRR